MHAALAGDLERLQFGRRKPPGGAGDRETQDAEGGQENKQATAHGIRSQWGAPMIARLKALRGSRRCTDRSEPPGARRRVTAGLGLTQCDAGPPRAPSGAPSAALKPLGPGPKRTSTYWPGRSSVRPKRRSVSMWTKMSGVPSPRVRKPKPRSLLNHLTCARSSALVGVTV